MPVLRPYTFSFITLASIQGLRLLSRAMPIPLMRRIRPLKQTWKIVVAVVLLVAGVTRADNELRRERLAELIKNLDAQIVPSDQRDEMRSMVRSNLRRRVQEANDRSREQWSKIETREQWEAFRNPRIEALRRSLGDFPDPPKRLNLRVTGKLDGDGYRIENVVYETRPGLWATANLYVPAKPTKSMPGILLCHSHHRPKEQGELQDMGMTWARAGCVVLVPDHLGHGERRQHPFRSVADYDGEFRVSRQDYYFRYDTGMQLHLVGESLIGWMVWDLMRGVDVLLSRKNVDTKKIILLGAVAGGGDPCAVAAALDGRISAAVPFNFGGPQPETRYPLPEDSETSFNYAGSGSWESTRNLRSSAAEGFLPWVIVSSIAPRRLIFAHEFNWHRERDPVWKRLQAVYGLNDAEDKLAYTHGRGELRGRPPEATHCTNVGPFHRRRIHEVLRHWFEIDVTPETEFQKNLASEKLQCMTDETRDEVQPQPLFKLVSQLADAKLSAARKRRDQMTPAEKRNQMRDQWRSLLGVVKPNSEVGIREVESMSQTDEITVQRLVLECQPGISVPMILLAPREVGESNITVVALAHAGKEVFLRKRSHEIAELLDKGASVCLPDLRGTGVSRGGLDHGQYSAATSRSSTELMLGGTTVGTQLSDLQAVVTFLRLRISDSKTEPRIILWGDSLSEVNSPRANFNMPRRIDGRPNQSEPLGGLLAMLGALLDQEIAGVYVRGGLANFRSVLQHQQVSIPHDVVIPSVLTTGDLSDVAAALAPRTLRLEGLVDGLNRRLPIDAAKKEYEIALQSYRKGGKADNFIISETTTSPAALLPMN